MFITLCVRSQWLIHCFYKFILLKWPAMWPAKNLRFHLIFKRSLKVAFLGSEQGKESTVQRHSKFLEVK